MENELTQYWFRIDSSSKDFWQLTVPQKPTPPGWQPTGCKELHKYHLITECKDERSAFDGLRYGKVCEVKMKQKASGILSPRFDIYSYRFYNYGLLYPNKNGWVLNEIEEPTQQIDKEGFLIKLHISDPKGETRVAPCLLYQRHWKHLGNRLIAVIAGSINYVVNISDKESWQNPDADKASKNLLGLFQVLETVQIDYFRDLGKCLEAQLGRST